MSRVYAQVEMTYAEYKICARVYKKKGEWFNVVGAVFIDDKLHVTRREKYHGIFWARKAMLEMLDDMHGNH